MNPQPRTDRRPFLADVIGRVPSEGPSHTGAHHRRPYVLTVRSAQGDRAPVTVLVLGFAGHLAASDQLEHGLCRFPPCLPAICTTLLRLGGVNAPEPVCG